MVSPQTTEVDGEMVNTNKKSKMALKAQRDISNWFEKTLFTTSLLSHMTGVLANAFSLAATGTFLAKKRCQKHHFESIWDLLRLKLCAVWSHFKFLFKHVLNKSPIHLSCYAAHCFVDQENFSGLSIVMGLIRWWPNLAFNHELVSISMRSCSNLAVCY